MTEKLKLTRKQAISECKKLWKPVVDGRAKNRDEALRCISMDLAAKISNYLGRCPLCEYTKQFSNPKCQQCPYFKKYHCTGIPPIRSNIGLATSPKAFALRIMEL